MIVNHANAYIGNTHGAALRLMQYNSIQSTSFTSSYALQQLEGEMLCMLWYCINTKCIPGHAANMSMANKHYQR